MDRTFTVGSVFECQWAKNYSETFRYNSIWMQTVFGCQILNVLQEMLHFNIKYVTREDTLKDLDLISELVYYNNASVDFFIRPLSLREDVMEFGHPVHHMFDWNFGFTIYRPEVDVNGQNIYATPFSFHLWYCLTIMAVFCSVLLYFFKYWEIKMLDGVQWECSFGYELLMVIGAYCQHIPPIDAVLYSRRGAYFAFFMFAYLIYTYYTSNLLSHIVNDKVSNIDADTILNSSLEKVILDDVRKIILNTINSIQGNNSKLLMKVLRMKPVSTFNGLKSLKSGTVALLSDYVTLLPFLRSVFEKHEICGLMNIDVSVSVEKYFFVSHQFPFRDEFKIALSRMQETGIIRRMLYNDMPKATCVPLLQVQSKFNQILAPLSILLGTYLLCVVILVGEIVHFRKHKLWPYVE